MTRESKFYNALKNIFVGAKVEGESGYINLMKIKSRYYEKGVFPKLQKDIDKALKPFPDFREELFEKLYTFFHRYFSESGSIYFRYTPLHQNIYEKVYTDDRDVMLFWKTHMLYYVKTDRLFKNLEVEIPPASPLNKGGTKGGFRFFFDVSQLEHKKAFEKKSVIYDFKEKKKNGILVFDVSYTERGKKTKITEILKALKHVLSKSEGEEGVTINEDVLERAFRIFEKQSEVDYFINKNAKEFLREQFNIWLYQYVFSGESEWTEERIKQLQILKDIAFKIINFISQFEDELVKIWNKPKFVLNSNYVITLDRILNPRITSLMSDQTSNSSSSKELPHNSSPLKGEDKGGGEKGMNIIKKLLQHQNFPQQVKEWQDLGIVDKDFNPKDVIAIPPAPSNIEGSSSRGKQSDVNGHPELVSGSHILNPKYKHLPIDTKYFKDLEIEILGLFDNLDESLDGWLIKSENYQALNTIHKKFKERIQCIYIDPPYNTGPSEILYLNKFKYSTWLTLMQDRLSLAKGLLPRKGILCVTIDHIELHHLRCLLEQVFGDTSILGIVCIKNNPSGRSTVKGFSIANEYAIFLGVAPDCAIGTIPRTAEQIAQYNDEDDFGRFQWRNLMRAGGKNDFRTARPRLYYPLFVYKENIRIPMMEWNRRQKKWLLGEQPESGEHVVYPEYEGNEYTWRLGIDTLNLRLSDVRARYLKRQKYIIEIKFRPDSEGILPKTVWDDKLFNATIYGTSLLRHIMGSSQTFDFPKSVYAVEECIRVCNTGPQDFVIDFFAGSGTTAHAVMDLNRKDDGRRKYLLIEMADYFYSVLLPRIKKLIFSDKWKEGKTMGGKGLSHFMKYYELEQYEDTLRKVKYDDSDLFENPYEDPYNQYIFMKDLKMLKALEIDYKNNKVKVDLSKLYPLPNSPLNKGGTKGGIDIPETLSNLLGKRIKTITADEVEFEDGEKIDINDLDYNIIKPLIWW